MAATFGASVAINDLKVDTTARLNHSSIASTLPTTIALAARSEDVAMISTAASGAGSIANSDRANTYAIAGSGAGAQNSYSNAITAEIVQSTISSTLNNVPSIGLAASSDEQLLAMAGGIDIAYASATNPASNPNATSLSVGASAAINHLGGAITAWIDGSSTVQANQLTISATDGSAVGAYAIAGAASASSSKLGSSFGGALVGAGTGNVITRSVDARIGDSAASTAASGVVRVVDATIRAQRSENSRIVADAAGVAIAAARSTNRTALSAGIAGAFSFNTISGGITAGVFNIDDFTATGNVTIEALAARGKGGGNIDSFAGGFGVSLNQSSGASAGGASLGLVVARNTINDPITAIIKNVKGGADNQIVAGTLSINANNDRVIKADAAGGALTISKGASTSASLAIGAVDGRNTISGDIYAGVDLGDAQLVTIGNGLNLGGIFTSLDL